jgi:hypothetical protein
LVHVWKAWPKTNRFCILLRFHELLPNFLEFWVIYKAHERHDKVIIFEFYGRFRELLPIVCGSYTMYESHDYRYMFERHDQKLIIFMFYWLFHELLPIVLGFRCDVTRPMTLSICLRGWPKNSLFSIFYSRFRELLPIVLGFRNDLQGPRYSDTCLRDMYKKRRFHVLSSFSWAISHLLELYGHLQGPWHLVHVWKAWKNSSFLSFRGPTYHRFNNYKKHLEKNKRRLMSSCISLKQSSPTEHEFDGREHAEEDYCCYT